MANLVLKIFKKVAGVSCGREVGDVKTSNAFRKGTFVLSLGHIYLFPQPILRGSSVGSSWQPGYRLAPRDSRAQATIWPERINVGENHVHTRDMQQKAKLSSS